jgi:hypothetical protein
MEIMFLYLDPGSGSMLVQFIIASILGATTFFKHIKLYIQSSFSKSPKDGYPAKERR